MVQLKRIVKPVGDSVELYTYSEKRPREQYYKLYGRDIIFVEELPDHFRDAWYLDLEDGLIKIDPIKARIQKGLELNDEYERKVVEKRNEILDREIRKSIAKPDITMNTTLEELSQLKVS